ncbi:MAG: tRNA (adenosine(37)-N6)-threonylcarbamoyltransferase complex ATPase subunit type 1 TsaE, partial [Candidatus Solibacter usitatus]|nr:tRNA (adenosine(37)-N6)-threonylcarbamoyltransferase complex ATPase subunit type 1 TsaE [Candidatus Solibacter usitatus]
MIALGRGIAADLDSGSVVLLSGNLGAGKTTLSKGIAEGLHATSADDVSSPTFTLIHEYGAPVLMVHIDLYRLEDPRQLATLGLEEIFERGVPVIIEWPERFLRWLPPAHSFIRIEHDGDAR